MSVRTWSSELAALSIELFVPDVAASLRFYEALGFELRRDDPLGSVARSEWVEFADIAMGGASLMLQDERNTQHAKAVAGGNQRGVGADIRIIVPDADAVCARAKQAGATIVREIGDRDYGLRDFLLRGPDGFRLRFATPIE